ncbi:MAG: NAD(+) synthase [Gemmatimonadota bacterium]
MLRIAIAQMRPEKTAYRDNLNRLGALFREVGAWPEPPELVIGPESALTGYFLEGGVRELALTADQLFQDLASIHQASGAPPFDIALGFYEVRRNQLYNSALYASLGGPDAGVRHVHRKIFLPTYGVFDEERFVEPGSSVQAFDTRWGRAALLICEDAWHSLTPTIAATDGAQLIIIPSATPARGIGPGNGEPRPANLDRWERLARSIAEEHGVYVVVAHLVGFEGGKGFVGGSVLAGPRGELLAEGPLFQPATIAATLDFDEITRARADQPLLSDLQSRLPHLLESWRSNGSSTGEQPELPERRSGPRSTGKRAPIKPSMAADPLAIDPELTRRWLVEFLRDEVLRNRKFENVVIGLSGGVDSSLVAYLAAEALGPEHVIGVRMPYRSSSPDSLAHAQLIIDALGIRSRTIDISAGVDGIAGAIDPVIPPGRLGNIMARMRMITLFDLSAEVRGLPLGTGNKTERLLGYFTWHADDSPPVNSIGDLFKTQVWELAKYVGVPDVIVSKPASADLITGQTDEGDFGISYPKADHILHWLLLGYRPEEIQAAGFTAEEIGVVQTRLESTHWKRRLPTVAMLSQTAIGEYYLRPVDY